MWGCWEQACDVWEAKICSKDLVASYSYQAKNSNYILSIPSRAGQGVVLCVCLESGFWRIMRSPTLASGKWELRDQITLFIHIHLWFRAHQSSSCLEKFRQDHVRSAFGPNFIFTYSVMHHQTNSLSAYSFMIRKGWPK